MLRKNTKGQAGGLGLTAGATLLVVGVVFLLIGIFIANEINTIINESLLTAAGFNTSSDVTRTNGTSGMVAAWDIFGNAMSGFTIAGISLIVIGAVVILSLLRNAF